MIKSQVNKMVGAVPVRHVRVLDWQRWTPYAAVAWSLIYAMLGIYWTMGGSGFPYAETMYDSMGGPVIGQFGTSVAWIIVMMAGIPAAVLGVTMLRGVRVLRTLFIAAGILLAGMLLLLMTDLNLLVLFGYIPYGIFSLFTGSGYGQKILGAWAQWGTIHQVLCLLGGFLWLAATVRYARLSGDACLYCGRQDGSEKWDSPSQAARWGRIAIVVAMVAPIFYAITRYAWALGIPLGITEAHLHSGQESGMWISGLFLANFGLAGAALMLGLVQRWGENFPRWMIGLAGRRIPIALAIIPASLVSVLLSVGGITIWTSLGQMIANMVASGAGTMEINGAIIFVVGPTLLFPVWGAALAVATLGYYYRRRGPCGVCRRGT